jgi:hypothetical protein
MRSYDNHVEYNLKCKIIRHNQFADKIDYGINLNADHHKHLELRVLMRRQDFKKVLISWG